MKIVIRPLRIGTCESSHWRVEVCLFGREQISLSRLYRTMYTKRFNLPACFNRFGYRFSRTAAHIAKRVSVSSINWVLSVVLNINYTVFSRRFASILKLCYLFICIVRNGPWSVTDPRNLLYIGEYLTVPQPVVSDWNRDLLRGSFFNRKSAGLYSVYQIHDLIPFRGSLYCWKFV